MRTGKSQITFSKPSLEILGVNSEAKLEQAIQCARQAVHDAVQFNRDYTYVAPITSQENIMNMNFGMRPRPTLSKKKYELFDGGGYSMMARQAHNGTTDAFLVPPGFSNAVNKQQFDNLIAFVKGHLHDDQLNESDLTTFKQLLSDNPDDQSTIDAMSEFYHTYSSIVNDYTDHLDKSEQMSSVISKFFARINGYGLEETFKLFVNTDISNNKQTQLQNLMNKMGLRGTDFTENDLQEIAFMIELAKDVSTHQNKLQLADDPENNNPYTQWQTLLSCAYWVQYVKGSGFIPSVTEKKFTRESLQSLDNQLQSNCLAYCTGFQVNAKLLTTSVQEKLFDRSKQLIKKTLLALNKFHSHVIIPPLGNGAWKAAGMYNTHMQLILDVIKDIKSKDVGNKFNLLIMLDDQTQNQIFQTANLKNIFLFKGKDYFSVYNHLLSQGQNASMVIASDSNVLSKRCWGQWGFHTVRSNEESIAQVLEFALLYTGWNQTLLEFIGQAYQLGASIDNQNN